MDAIIYECPEVVGLKEAKTMLKYVIRKDKKNDIEWIETNLTGKPLLLTPLLNKGTAFTEEERKALKILGKLPYQIESLEEQLIRVKDQFDSHATTLQKYIYLNNLQDKNEVLFYKLLTQYLDEMIPLIYTPGVSDAVKSFSRLFRQPRGLYIAYPDIDHIEDILDNRTHASVDVIVVTDGQRVLGIGDQGVGGMDISISKLVLYTIGGIDPYYTLPIVLDVGTDNEALLNNPEYLGWRHPRLHGEVYDEFVDKFVKAITKKFPNSLLHWEDFGQKNARRFLEKYRQMHCCFNDDMQGTAVVTLAALLSAIEASHAQLKDQRIIIFGAGTAGVGIADELKRSFCQEGIPEKEACRQFWLIDKQGLLFENDPSLVDFQKPYARPKSELAHFENQQVTLKDVMKVVKPTILIGCSTIQGAFNEEIVRLMASHTPRPIIFPLSNPPEKAEANPQDLIQWSNGKALVATGSPFTDVIYEGKAIKIAQCNNALGFPGIGLGVVATGAKRVTDGMLYAAAKAIVEKSPILKDPSEPLLPKMSDIPNIAYHVACAVANQAVEDGVAKAPKDTSVTECVFDKIWRPYYRPIKFSEKVKK